MFLLISHNSAIGVIVLNFLAEERCCNPLWAIPQTNGGVGYCMTRILNEEQRERSGRRDRQREGE